MAEETATETPAVETGAETATETAESTSAETENTEQAVDRGQGPIPYARFKEVNDERKSFKTELDTVRRELDAIRAESTAKPKVETETGPPEGMTAEQKLDWYITRRAKKMIEEEFEMPIGEIKTLLGVNREYGNDYAERKWAEVCKEVGADPMHDGLRHKAAERIKRGYTPNDAARLAAEDLKLGRFAEKRATGTTASVETDGVTGAMTAERWIPKDKREATEAASKGKRAPHLTAEEIFQESDKRRAKR